MLWPRAQEARLRVEELVRVVMRPYDDMWGVCWERGVAAGEEKDLNVTKEEESFSLRVDVNRYINASRCTGG